MLEPTKTKWHWFELANAPSLTNNHGSLVNLLDACLVNGYNQQAIITSSLDESYLLTINLNEGHNFRSAQVVCIENANDSAFNRDFRIKSHTTSSITIQLDETFSGKSLTGLATVKAAPCGWEIVYTSGFKRGYKQLSEQSDGLIFYVNDEKDPLLASSANYAKYARVCLCEYIDDNGKPAGETLDGSYIDGYYSSTTQTESNLIIGRQRIYYARLRGSADNTTPLDGNRRWYIVGDDRSVYIMPGIYPTTNSYGGQLGSNFVGHVELFNPNEKFSTSTALFTSRHTFVINSSSTNSPWSYESLFSASSERGAIFNHGGHLDNLWSRGLQKSSQAASQSYSGSSTTNLAPPEDYQDAIIASPMYIYLTDNSKYSLIGKFPGTCWFADSVASYYNTYTLWYDQKSSYSKYPFQVIQVHYADGYAIMKNVEDWY